MTWVRFKKAYVFNDKKRPMGKVVNIRTSEARELECIGVVEMYTGPFPPVKMKTDLFKPK